MLPRSWFAARVSFLAIAVALTLLPGYAAPPAAQAANGGAMTWYFAEGFTGAGFDEYLTILNPNPSPAPVTITYFLRAGAPVTKSLTVAASSRRTVTVHDGAEGVGRNQEVAAKVETTNAGGVIVERPMYFRYGSAVTGGHTVLGVTAPRQAWYFAEGFTGTGFDQYLTLLNPNAAAAPVTITYFLNGAAPVTKTLSVAGNARRTVAVHEAAEGVGRGKEVSAKVETTLAGGIVVERPMYFTYNGTPGVTNVTGGHVVAGAAAPAASWLFAEGFTGAGFDEYLTILNPNATAAAMTITYFLTNGTTQVRNMSVPANTRMTVTVHDPAQGVGRNQEVSARVTTTNPGGIVVERPMYFNYGGAVDGGHDVMGATAAATAWYFAEGFTGTGFDEYLTILNPGAGAANLTITYFLNNAAPVTKTLTVAASSRRTVTVHDAALGVGRNREVAAKVESTNGAAVVVERPMYFNYSGSAGSNLTGGHNALGHRP